MKKISELTVDEYKVLLKEFYAPKKKRSKMDKTEIKDLAIKMNQKLNIPLINELNEEKIYIKIVLKIDGFLYNNLPNELYNSIRDIDNGISDNEAKNLIIRLSKLANKKINIPYIPEKFEYKAIRFIIGIVINASRKLFNLEKATNIMLEKELTETKKFNIADANNMLA